MKRIPTYCEKCGNCPEFLVRLTGGKIQVGSEMATFTRQCYFLILLSSISNASLIMKEIGRFLRDCKEYCNSHMHVAGGSRSYVISHINFIHFS